MSPTRILRHLRLFPAVIIVGGGLLAIKSFGLVHTAYAQTAVSGQVAVASVETQVAVADPSVDDADSSSAAEVDVLTSLSKRRTALDAREQSLDMQANLIAAAEARVDTKIARLKDMQAQMQTLLGQRDAADQAQLNALMKTYSSMKPADAARIFNQLDETVELNVSALMKADVLGAILAKMQPEVAQKLTVRLANRLKLPDPAPAMPAAAPTTAIPIAAPAQTASLDPAAATPTPVMPSATAPATTPAADQAAPPPKQAAATPPAATPAPKPQAAATPAPSTPAPTTAKPMTANAAPKPLKPAAPPAARAQVTPKPQAASTTPTPAPAAAAAPPPKPKGA